MTHYIALCCAIALALALPCATTHAAVNQVDQFTGDLTETWESFPNAGTPTFHYLPATTPIMGAGATISNPRMVIYEPAANYDFGIGIGLAAVSDGTKGMGVNDFAQTTTLRFLQPIHDFGSYWGANIPVHGDGVISITFDNGLSETFTYNNPTTLDWHGWHSTIGFTTITYSGDFVVIDGLQANIVPEPSALSLVALGIAVFVSRPSPGGPPKP